VSSAVAFFATRAGSTSTYLAICTAWTRAQHSPTLLVDADMSGGTIADVLALDSGSKSIGNVLHSGPPGELSADALLAQAVRVPSCRNLMVIPGIRSSYGRSVASWAPALSEALRGVPQDVAIVDLGTPLAHPELTSPRNAGLAITRSFARTFIVVRDDPALAVRSIDVLSTAGLTGGEVIVCQGRHRQLRKEFLDLLQSQCHQLKVLDVGWCWDEKRYTRMGDEARPVELKGLDSHLGLQP